MKEFVIRRDVIAFDLAAIPSNMTMDDMMPYFEAGYVFYDSSLKTNPTFNVYPIERIVLIYDISTEDGKKIYEEITLNLEKDGKLL